MTLINNMTNSRRMYDSESSPYRSLGEIEEQRAGLKEKLEALKTASPEVQASLIKLRSERAGFATRTPDELARNEARDATNALANLKNMVLSNSPFATQLLN